MPAGENSYSIFRRLAVEVDRIFKTGVYVLQIGGNDGTLDDPVGASIRQFGWSATIYEPMPEYFSLLRATYANYPRVECVSAAVSSEAGNGILFYVDPAFVSSGHHWAQGLASFRKKHLERHGIPEEFVKSKEISIVSTDSITTSIREAAFKMLCIDVEGHENVILSGIGEKISMFDLVMFERKHMPTHMLEDIRREFAARGFTAFDTMPDEIFIKNTSMVEVR